jgi:protein-tyrosine kinase
LILMDDELNRDRTATSPLHYSARDPGRIGELLVKAGLISTPQAQEIADYGAAHNVRFGEAAVALGRVSTGDLDRALAAQFDALAPDAAGVDERLIAFTQPASQGAEDFRSLRNALALRWFKHPQGARTLSVISPTRQDGRSTVAANLAITFAQVGFRTLLVDADMRNPMQHRLFNLDDRFGLATYLAGRPEEAAFYDIRGIPNLTVIPVGGLPPNPQELLLRGLLQVLLRRAEEQFEVVILDTPAASTASDYQLISAEAIGALLVTNRNHTRTRDAKKLVKQCRDFGIRLVGSTMASAG